MDKNAIPVEIERKYLVKMPNLAGLSSLPSYTESEIEQVYLFAGEGKTHRIRRRTTGGVTVYTETVKERKSALSHYENEREIDRDTYLALYEKRDRDRDVIRKRRLTFVYEGQLFEVDIFPFYEKIAVVETELSGEDEEAVFPPYLDVLCEVTGDGRFSNAALSLSHPEEGSLLP